MTPTPPFCLESGFLHIPAFCISTKIYVPCYLYLKKLPVKKIKIYVKIQRLIESMIANLLNYVVLYIRKRVKSKRTLLNEKENPRGIRIYSHLIFF